MGKKITIWLNEEAYSFVGEVDGKGTIINQLIIDHFSNDEAVLEEKMNGLTRQRDMIKAQLVDLREARLREQNLRKRKEELTKEEKEHRFFIEDLKGKWQRGEITDDEYWANFN